MMEWIFSVSLVDKQRRPLKVNFSVRNVESDEQARRTIVHDVLATGGVVTKIEEPELPLEPLHIIGGYADDELS